MAQTGIQVKGLSELQRWMLAIAPKTRKAVQVETEATIRLMQGEAVRRAPVDTGKLRQSISFEIGKGGLSASLSANVEYWAYVEFGTGGEVEVPDGFEDLAGAYKGSGKRTINRPAQPFLIPAYLKYRDEYYNRIQQALDRIFR